MSHFLQLPEACSAPDGTVALYVEHEGRMVRVDLSVLKARKLTRRLRDAADAAEMRALRNAREAEEMRVAVDLEAARASREVQGGAS